MSSPLDKKKNAEETKFSRTADFEFKSVSRRNKLLGLWAADILGLSKSEADEFAKQTVLSDFEVHAATDITGFGLAGHALEMISGSELTFNFELENIPIFAEAEEMYKKGISTRMNKNNKEIVKNNWSFANKTEFIKKELMLDPQTNGGLLIAVPESKTPYVINALHESGIIFSSKIGYVSEFTKSKIRFF